MQFEQTAPFELIKTDKTNISTIFGPVIIRISH